jgi:peptidoglycan-associated lipoprotein
MNTSRSIRHHLHAATSTRKRIALAGVLVALLGACSSSPVATPAASTPPAAQPAAAAPTTTATTTARLSPVAEPAQAAAPTPPSAATAAAQAAPASTVAGQALPAYLDPNSDISTRRSIYFDFDQTMLKSDAQGVVARHGKFLSANPTLNVRIEGNTDERGSTEYNLALGQKRAEAVRQALKVVGVREAQMETTSWGEGHPQAPGHDEAAWSQNRRADLQYPTR